MSFHPEDNALRHHYYEDIAAILLGTGLVALGVVFYAEGTLATGGTVGLAFLAHYATGLEIGLAFFLVNVPFYLFALWRMGWAFALKSFLSVSLVSFYVTIIPNWVEIGAIQPLFAAIGGGAMMGFGMLMLFRHRASLGGVNILALYLQEEFGLRAGYLQLGLDAAILALSLLVLPPPLVLISMVGAAVLNLIIAMNHKPGRYVGVS